MIMTIQNKYRVKKLENGKSETNFPDTYTNNKEKRKNKFSLKNTRRKFSSHFRELLNFQFIENEKNNQILFNFFSKIF